MPMWRTQQSKEGCREKIIGPIQYRRGKGQIVKENIENIEIQVGKKDYESQNKGEASYKGSLRGMIDLNHGEELRNKGVIQSKDYLNEKIKEDKQVREQVTAHIVLDRMEGFLGKARDRKDRYGELVTAQEKREVIEEYEYKVQAQQITEVRNFTCKPMGTIGIQIYYVYKEKELVEIVYEYIISQRQVSKVVSNENIEVQRRYYSRGEEYRYVVRKGERGYQDLERSGVEKYITSVRIVSRYNEEVEHSMVSQDIETYEDSGEQKVYACGYRSKNGLKMYYLNEIEKGEVKDRQNKHEYQVYKMFKSIENEELVNPVLYFHNQKFDGCFIQRAQRAQGYKIKVKGPMVFIEQRKEGMRWQIQDSYRQQPLSQASWSKHLDQEETKGEFDHESVNRENQREKKEEQQEYQKKDINVQWEGLNKFRELGQKYKNPVDIQKCKTQTSLSYFQYQRNYNKRGKMGVRNDIYSVDTRVDDYIKQATYGGVAEVYRRTYNKGDNGSDNAYYYDVNSQYPSVMKNSKMPIGQPTYVNQEGKKVSQFFGFALAEVSIGDIDIPFLCIKNRYSDDRPFNPKSGKWTGWYFSEDQKYAEKQGYDIKQIKGIKYKGGIGVFKSFVEEFNKIKEEGKKINNKAQVTFAKGVMNRLAGRWAQSRITTEIDVKGKGVDLITKPRTVENKWNNCRALFAAITSYARINIHKKKMEYKDNQYYSDTDSQIQDREQEEKDIDSKEQGKYKLEYKIEKGVFVKPKVYGVRTETGEEKQVQAGVKERDKGQIDIKKQESLQRGEIESIKIETQNQETDWVKQKVVRSKVVNTQDRKDNKRKGEGKTEAQTYKEVIKEGQGDKGEPGKISV